MAFEECQCRSITVYLGSHDTDSSLGLGDRGSMDNDRIGIVVSLIVGYEPRSSEQIKWHVA